MFALVCAALFWPGLWGGEVSAFRDGFHFYFPQSVWLDQAAQRGEYFPQWQSEEALGISVPGETTSAIYYPPRIVWLVLGKEFIGLDVAQRMALFVVAHLLLAAGGMVYACARWGLRREASWLAGAAFAFSCPVFYLHHNLVFLCSAAWLGFAFAEVGCWLRGEGETRCAPRMTVLAGALAMMVLAGDPHTAVNVVVVSVFLKIAKTIARRKLGFRGVGGFRGFVGSMGWLSGAVGLAIALSAVQSIPSLLWATQSHRWLGGGASRAEQVVAPENSVPRDLLRIVAEPATPAAHAIYEFSLSPWHLLTALWPTLGGDFVAGNARTFAFIPAEGRMWIPSLFLGVLSLLLLVRRKSESESGQHRWWLWGAGFAFLAALGNYSLGWGLRELLEAAGAVQLAAKFPADHTSSVYGWLSDLLPGYSVFRYPAKWTVITMACLSLAVAVRFDRFSEADLMRSGRGQRFVMVVSGLALLLTVVIGLQGVLGEAALKLQGARLPDAWLGLPDMTAMWQQLLIAFAVPSFVLLLLVGVRLRAADLQRRSPRVRLPVHALFAWLTLLETFVVASTWVSFVAVDSMNATGPWTAEVVWADAREADIAGDGWLDARGRNARGGDARVKITDYQRQFALGKLALLSHQRNLAASLSIEPERLKRLRSGLSRMDTLAAEQPQLDEVLGWLGVERRLVRARSETGPASFRWQQVAQVKPLCEFMAADSSAQRTGSVSWQWLKSGRLEVVVDSPVPGKLLVRQFNDGGWVVRGEVADIKAARDDSGLFIEVTILAGKSRLLVERASWPLRLGAAISFFGFLVVVVLVAVQVRRGGRGWVGCRRTGGLAPYRYNWNGELKGNLFREFGLTSHGVGD